MKNIKKFDNHAEYLAFKNSSEYITPNVSWCFEEGHMHYSEWEDSRIIAKFYVENDEDEIYIMSGSSSIVPSNIFSSIEIDGEVMQTMANSHVFETAGEHTVIYAPYSPNNLPSGLFNGCDMLTEIRIPNTIASLPPNFLRSCVSLVSLTIPDSVTSIGQNFCTYSESLTDVHIGTGLTSISRYSFGACSALTSFLVPDNITTIEEGAFQTSGLTDITIGNGITTIGSLAFQFTSIERLTLHASTPPSIASDTFGELTGFNIYVPSNSVNAYKQANGWSTYSNNIFAIAN